MRREFVIILLFSLFTFHFSLCYADHLFEFGLHGGIAAWSSQPIYVNKQVGLAGGAHLYYAYLSPHVLGFRTGLTLDGHNVGFGKTDYEDHYTTIDVENQQMEIDYTIGSLRERYATWSAGIPLQLALSRKNVLFLAGAKAVFPFFNSWDQSVRDASLSVNYPDYDNRVYESYPLAASRHFTMDNSGRLALPNIQWWLTTELSYIIPLNTWSRRHRSYIVVGAYFDYCFTRYTPSQSSAESLIMLSDTRDGFPLQRILTPVMEANRQGRKLINDCTPFYVGLKISYALSPYNPYSRHSRSCNCL